MDMSTLRAGTAKSDITTSQEGIVIHDPLHAKALVIDDGKIQVVILAMDLVALAMICDVADDFMPTLRGRIEAELGIPGDHVLVNASRRMLCEDEELVERTLDAVRRAQENLTPVTMGSGVGYEDRFQINRTLRLKNGKGWTIRHANPCPPDDEVASLGPVDPDIGVLRFDRVDGGTLAVVYNFACHLLLGVPGGAITANFPGFASEVIEETLGDGAMALFLQGTGGDMTEVLYKDVNHPRDAEPPGRMLGVSALKAIREIETGDAELAVARVELALPRRTDIPERLAELEAERDELLVTMRGTSLSFRTFVPLYIKHMMNPDFPADYSYRYMHDESIGKADLRAMDAENERNMAKYRANIETMEKLARIQDKMGTRAGHFPGRGADADRSEHQSCVAV